MAEADGAASKKLGLRVQKKLLGKLASKKTVKAVVDDDTYSLIDEVAGLAAAEKDAKFSEKFVKDLIKIVLKIGILLKNDQFDEAEHTTSVKFQRKLNSIVMTFISFYEVDYSLDSAFLVQNVTASREMLHSLIQRHLTEKSHKRIDTVFDFFSQDMFEKLFDPSGPHRERLGRIVALLAKLVDEDKL